MTDKVAKIWGRTTPFRSRRTRPASWSQLAEQIIADTYAAFDASRDIVSSRSIYSA